MDWYHIYENDQRTKLVTFSTLAEMAARGEISRWTILEKETETGHRFPAEQLPGLFQEKREDSPPLPPPLPPQNAERFPASPEIREPAPKNPRNADFHLPASITSLLLKDEKVIYAKKPVTEAATLFFRLCTAGAGAGFVFLLILLLSWSLLGPGLFTILYGMFYLIFLAFYFMQFLPEYYHLLSAIYIITDMRTIVETHFVSSVLKIIKHRDIRVTTVRSGPIQQFFHLSTVTISTAAEGTSSTGTLSLIDINVEEVMKCYEPYVK